MRIRVTERLRVGRWLGALGLVFLVAVSYLPALRDGFIWDDDDNVTTNFNLHDLEGLRRIWTNAAWNLQQYYPLTHTSFWLEYHFWGLDPFGYHLVNVALHALSAVLLWRVLQRLGVPGAWLAAAIFGLHPLQVESVAWITERKNTLSGIFFLGAALAGVNFLNATDNERPGTGRASRPWLWCAVCLALFLCALLAKTATCVLPVVLALLFWWKKGRLPARDLLLLLPLTLLGAAFGLQTAGLEQYKVGAAGAEFDFSLTEKFLIAGRAFWFYLGKIVFPAGLSFIYPRWRIDTTDPSAYVYPAAALAVFGGLWALRDRVGRGTIVAALYYAVVIFPALGFFKVFFMKYSFVQDHFQYLAGIGPIVLCVAIATKAARPDRRDLLAATSILLLLLLGVLTWQRSKVYMDAETIWNDTVARNPEAWIAHNNLGAIRMTQGRYEEAAGLFRTSLKLQPESPKGLVNLGDALLFGGDAAGAIPLYQRAAELSPGLSEARLGLGVALDRAGRGAEAETQFEEAMRLNPHGAEAPYYLARLRFRRGDTEQAALLLESLLSRKPLLATAHGLYAEVLAAQGKAEEAERHYQEAARLSAPGTEKR